MTTLLLSAFVSIVSFYMVFTSDMVSKVIDVTLNSEKFNQLNDDQKEENAQELIFASMDVVLESTKKPYCSYLFT